jgi:uncharacterized protein YdaU (DUF1376 family)
MFASDWLGSTSHALMSPEERGAYMDLLCHQWGDDNCCLPDDDGILEALGGLPKGHFKGTSRVLRDCFPNHPIIGGCVANRKLLALWEGREEQRRKSSEGGKKSAKLRKEAKGTSRVLEGGLGLGCKKNPTVGQLTTTITTTTVKEAPVVPSDEIVIAWNQTKGVARIRKLTDARKRTLKIRLVDPDWDWKAALAKFPLGFQGSADRPWSPDFDWFIKTDSVNRILEGKYDNGSNTKPLENEKLTNDERLYYASGATNPIPHNGWTKQQIREDIVRRKALGDDCWHGPNHPKSK